MTIRPTDLPVWCTAPVDPTDKTAPDNAKKLTGFKRVAGTPEKPPFQDFNWYMNNVYLWMQFIEARFKNAEFLAIANNQVAPADLTGALFAPATYRAVKLKLAYDGTYVGPTIYTGMIEFYGVWNGTAWVINQTEPVGSEAAGITLSMTAAGQVQYTSINRAGFVGCRATFHAEGMLAT